MTKVTRRTAHMGLYGADAAAKLNHYTDKSAGACGCWLWTGAIGRFGYGRQRVHGKRYGAHRLAWVNAFGPIPRGKLIMHHCDNRRCVNPFHLSVGTNKDNMADRDRKGRQAKGPRLSAAIQASGAWWASLPRGEQHKMAKFTEAQIRSIRVDPRPRQVVADEYGVPFQTIYRIRDRTTWAWLPD